MSAERVDDDRRHDQGSPASLRFCLDELRALMWDSLRCSANSKHAGFEVDVGPLEPKRLALTKAKGQRDRVQGLEAVASRGVKQEARVGRRQRQDLAARHARS